MKRIRSGMVNKRYWLIWQNPNAVNGVAIIVDHELATVVVLINRTLASVGEVA